MTFTAIKPKLKLKGACSYNFCNSTSPSIDITITAVLSNSLVIIAATNRLEDLDEAIIRRFESKIYVGVPDESNRVEMLQKYMIDVECSLERHDLNEIATRTEGWSGSDIEVLPC
jgi:SpoVK/Ycf46/Vps4 family AAA+-type ATPase